MLKFKTIVFLAWFFSKYLKSILLKKKLSEQNNCVKTYKIALSSEYYKRHILRDIIDYFFLIQYI